MARSYDIAEIMTSDGGLTEQVRRKINANFRRVTEIATRETSELYSGSLTAEEIDIVTGGGTVTNNKMLTGTGLSYLWGKLKAAFSSIGHKHSAADVTSGTLPIDHGGTGAATAAEALAALGITIGEGDAPETGAPGSIYIKML